MERERPKFAEALADRIADLLSAPVRIIDDSGAMLADIPSGERDETEQEPGENQTEYLRIHTEAHGQRICIIVGEPQSPDRVPRSVAYTIIDLVVKQRLTQAELESGYDERNTFIRQLLLEPPGDDRQVLRRARKLGMDLDRPRVVILVGATEYISMSSLTSQRFTDRRTRRRVQFVLDATRRFLPGNDDVLAGYLGDGYIALLKSFTAPDLRSWWSQGDALAHGENWANLRAAVRCGESLYQRLRAELKTHFTVAVGRFYNGTGGLAHSYRDALAAIKVAENLHETGRAFSIDTLGLDAYAWLRDDDLKVELARQVLSPVNRDPDLRETLSVFFHENCSLVAAAHRLSLHRNTLAYRLDKIASITGLDPRTIDDAAQLRLAMLVSTRRPPETLHSLGEGGALLDA